MKPFDDTYSREKPMMAFKIQLKNNKEYMLCIDEKGRYWLSTLQGEVAYTVDNLPVNIVKDIASIFAKQLVDDKLNKDDNQTFFTP